MSRPALSLRKKLSLRIVSEVVIIGLVLYLVLAGLGGLNASLNAVRSADPEWIGAAMLAVGFSYVCATWNYMLLAARQIKFLPTLWVQWAGCLVNRLLPAGLGGMGLNAYYLHRHGHSTVVASATAAANSLLGFVGNVLLLIGVLGVSPLPFSVDIFDDQVSSVMVAVGIGAALIILIVWKRTVLIVGLKQSAEYIRLLRSRPGRTCGALVSSMALTALHALGLYCVLHALHVPASYALSLLAVSAGSLGGGLAPTPGGLGGAEAGIAAVLISFSVPAAAATAAALTYRGITYWLPLLPGYVALKVVEKRYI